MSTAGLGVTKEKPMEVNVLQRRCEVKGSKSVCWMGRVARSSSNVPIYTIVALRRFMRY